MEIQDGGDGFDWSGKHIAGNGKRIGLLGMKERFETTGGCFQPASCELMHIIIIKTVERHRDQVMKKPELPNTASLTLYAIAHGIIGSSAQVTNL